MRALAFAKYEGLGNDFVVVDAASEAALSPDDARAICDRRRGVGADGVLLVLPARDPNAVARMRVLNADGSVPEMCGNGLRCAVLHVARTRGDVPREMTIETYAGPRAAVLDREGDRAMVSADMGVVRAGADVALDGVELTLADAGNPHAVAFREVDDETFARLGPSLSAHPRFGRGVNVEFVRVSPATKDAANPDLHVRVWERGAGPTLACGTGACAVVAVATAKGLVRGGAIVRVILPGGPLEIRHDPVSARTSMRGPARFVFSGALP
jgi:diaminopimelate epimerase